MFCGMKELQIKLSIKPSLLNANIFKFTTILLKYIFLKKNQKKGNAVSNKLDEWIKAINDNIIKKSSGYINKEYSINNLKNIILFIKKQNNKYHGDIIENILIYIFSFAFQCEPDYAFCKLIFNNLNRIRDQNNPELIKWIKNSKFAPYELDSKGLKELLEVDGNEDSLLPNENMKTCVLYNFLRDIIKNKYEILINNNSRNKSYMHYINNGNYFALNISEITYNKIRINDITAPILDKDTKSNSIMNQDKHYSSPISDNNKPIIQIIRSFFTQVYIFYQNKNSPLFKYQIPNQNLARIPFTYDLRGACVEGRFAYVVFSPLRLGDFVSNFLLRQNNLRESGMYELGKLCVFNDKIKILEYDTNLLRSNYIYFLPYAMCIYDNHSVIEINLSYNYLREESDEYLIKILKHFKELKTLNISSNELKKGLAGIFIVLKNLYRKKETKLENLIISKTFLDDSSFYELAQLLKCKYCKLKKIYLNENAIPSNYNFLKSLKKNESLKEIYLNRTNINNDYVDEILRIISNSNIKHLYIFKNRLNNFNDLLRILNRTRIIINDKNKNNKNINKKILIRNENTALVNLDISNNDFPIKNVEHIKLLNSIFKETSLYCLDMSHILLGTNPDKRKADITDYKKAIDNMKLTLEKKQELYSEDNRTLRRNKVKINKLKKFENQEFVDKYKLKDKLGDIFKNPNCKYRVYLLGEAYNILMQKEKDKKEEKKNEIYENKEEEDEEDIITKIANYLELKVSENKVKEIETKKDIKKLIII